MKKVVLLAPTPPPAGGIASWTMRMLSATLKNDWQVGIVDEKVIGDRQIFGAKKTKSLFDEIKRCLIIWKKLIGELKDKDVKVIHSCIPALTFSMLRELVCAIITKAHGRKFIIHFRCTVPNTTKGKISQMILGWLCNKSDYIIVLNEQSFNYIKKFTKTPVETIPNFISANEIKEKKNISDVIRNVVYTGGVIEEKGAKDIIELAKRFSDINFRLVGKFDENIKNSASDIENVIFTGQVDKEQVSEELESADVFLFMTYFYGEGFSNSLAEAMAKGLPCIVTDWAANKDMIGETGGFVVDVGDLDAAETALKLMNDPKLRFEQSTANICKAKNCYIDEIVIGKYVDVYDSFL